MHAEHAAMRCFSSHVPTWYRIATQTVPVRTRSFATPPTPPPNALQIIGCSMLKALEQVHAAGFIHRDVKPANFVMDPANSQEATAGG